MIGFPLDSHVTFDTDGTPVYDRAITSAPYRELLKRLFTNGVLPDVSTNLQVIAKQNMTVTVQAGFAMVEGCMKLQERNIDVTLENSTDLPRIDLIVMRLDVSDDVRSCELSVVKGTPATTPTEPQLTRNTSVYDIALASIRVNANVSTLSNANITDLRYNTSKCGVISSLSEYDTTTIYNQVQADLTEFQTVTYEEFEEWFDGVKSALAGDTAGNLLSMIQSLNSEVDELKKSVRNGKATVATAITSKGVATASDATFATMASNINSIQLGSGNVKANEVLGGKTYSSDEGTNLTGTMPVKNAWTSTTSGSGKITIPEGYHNGSGYVDATGAYNAGVTATKKGTASAGDVLSGKTFTNSSSVGASGTLKDNSGTTVTASAVSKDTTYTYLTVPENAKYSTSSKIRTLNSNLTELIPIIKDGVVKIGTLTALSATNTAQSGNIKNVGSSSSLFCGLYLTLDVTEYKYIIIDYEYTSIDMMCFLSTSAPSASTRPSNRQTQSRINVSSISGNANIVMQRNNGSASDRILYLYNVYGIK